MSHLIRFWAQLVVRGRWLILALVTLLAGLSFLPMGNLYYDNSNENYFVQGDPNLKAFNRLLELYGDVEYLTIGVVAPKEDPDLFTPRSLEVIRELTDFLESRPEITRVRSLSKYQYTHSGDGMMATDDLIEDIHDPDELARARDIIRNEPLALGTLITDDLRHTRVAGRMRYEVGSTKLTMSLMSALHDFIAEGNYEARGYPLHLSGPPVFTEQFEVLTKRDQSWINPTMALIMVIILFISFRSITGMVAPWAIIGAAILLVTGIQGLLGWPHTVVSTALVPTLIIIGVGICVHVIVEFYHFRAKGQTPEAAAASTVEHLWRPALFTALTTAAGFLALGVTELLPVRQFAWLGAIGAMILFLLSMTLLPALLSFVSRFNPHTANVMNRGAVTVLTQRLPDFTRRWRRSLTAVGAALLLLSLWLVPNLQVDSNFVTYFKPDNPTRADLLYFDDTFNGIQNIDLMIDSGDDGNIHEPDFLRQVEQLQDWLLAQEETGRAVSLLDFHKQINQALNYDDPDWYRLPDSREMAAQFLLLYENTGPEEDLSDARDYHDRYLRLSVPIRNMPASTTADFLQRVRQQIAEHHPALDVEITGSLVMYNAQDIYINHGMARSFLLALIIIGLSFMVLFRSVKYGIIALVPSIVPILMTGALLVVLGIPLNLGTMIVGAMTMGIAVDDAIHVMSRYLLAKRSGASTHDAITLAMTQAGRAVVFTSIVLVTGFSVMLLGSFIPYIYTGMFAATIMALALLGDLIFLPALLYLIDGRLDARDSRHADSQELPTQEARSP